MNTQYLTLKEYQDIASKIINASFPKIAQLIIKDNDKYGEVVKAVMMADYKWDGRGTLVGYRKQRVQWCVQDILTKEKNKPLSLNFNITDSMELLETIPDRIAFDEIEYTDKLENLRVKIQKSNVLTDKEKKCMGLYFSNTELDTISAKMAVSKESIKSTIRRGLQKMGKIE